jgi:hypothetical protein
MRSISSRLMLIWILFSLMLVGLIACSSKSEDNTFVLEGYGTLRYPGDWYLMQGPPSEFIIVGPKGTTLYQSDMKVGIWAADPRNTQATQAWQQITSGRQWDMQFKIIQAPVSYQLDGSEGIRVEYVSSGPNAAKLFHGLMVIAPHPTSGKLVLIDLAAIDGKWSSFSTTAESLLSTFKWSR